MRTFDRVVLVVLALGIWALVLKPSNLTAHGSEHDHITSCDLSGVAHGNASDGHVQIYEFGGVHASCSTY
jgi:hypothetical protein